MNFLALVTGSLFGKIALDIMIMASTEFAEALRALRRGPQHILDHAAEAQPDLVGIDAGGLQGGATACRLLDAMVQDLERATGPWHAEWMAVPEGFVLTAGALNQAKFALAGLVVDEKRMADNLDISRGLIVAEAVMMGLATQMSRRRRMMSSTTPASSPTKRA